MKKISNKDGIAGWKIDHPAERWLAKAADKSEFAKKLYVDFYRIFDREYYEKGLRFIDKNISTFAGQVSDAQRAWYIRDMVYSLHRFGCMFDEYFLFDFPRLNTRGRESFITDKIRWDYYARMNLEENKILFNDKKKAYELFGQYYGRELIEVTGDHDREAFLSFAARHPRFMVKPFDGSGGKGIFIADSHNFQSEDDLFQTIRRHGHVVVEELIEQTEKMASLHPASLNTVRVPTLKLKDRIEVLNPTLRIGRGGSVVDNASSGGIIVSVDAASGICIRKGMDEHNGVYLQTPDTGVVLPGFQIPRWEEALLLVKALAEVVPGNHYVGWDIALTDHGWVMVEGNPRGQLLMQITEQKGIRTQLEQYIQQM